MTPIAPQFPEISGYTITEQLYLGSRTAVCRAIQDNRQLPVVIKVLQREYPTFGELVQFRNQYAIAKNLPIDGIIQPLSLETLGNGYVLVMADWGGISLEKYIQQQLDLAEKLAIAVQITDILRELHQHRVIHKDIKPANILIHPQSKQVKLIDFSIASLLPKETQEIQNLNTLEGTLAYLAPEQTGRMNRGIDYRSDFYAFGVTLYQLFTGRLPFITDDPLELVHCHIANITTPIHEVNTDVPKMLGTIVAKLMAKNAEDRYQSALGLKHDLGECLNQWKETSSITEFELGQRDLCDRFIIPEKLYGREEEVQTLLEAFERVTQGASEMMLVAGFSGIGKTAVVNEVHKPIVKQRGYFIKGKFDQFNRNIPFSAFVLAFRDLMGQLLSESDTQLQTWRTQILEALGENAQVIIELIPELERIIGHQPPAPELSGTAAQNRFNLLFQRFIQVFTSTEHPLVMFLDDLQWADSASLNLIQVLMSEVKTGCLLLLGAYRDNEVFAAHPLMLTLSGMEKAGAAIHTITLQTLSFTSLNYLVADTLHGGEKVVKPLTELVMEKTQGNPFFATQFLKALYQEQLITFDRDAGHWQCDIVQVRDAALTSDVVEFMALQLQKLPESTQEILKLASCIGAQFDLETLAIVSQQLQTEVAAGLWKALQEGLILPITKTYKFFQSAETEPSTQAIAVPYKF
ncbi:MAG: serine/threonine-protein kinase PknK, partial [Rivularia sp. (in: cyanobacteria)]